MHTSTFLSTTKFSALYALISLVVMRSCLNPHCIKSHGVITQLELFTLLVAVRKSLSVTKSLFAIASLYNWMLILASVIYSSYAYPLRYTYEDYA